jgi:hypothetical protein
MKHIIIFIEIILCISLVWSCTDVKDWHDEADSTPPGKVTNVSVENLSGGAQITYASPQDPDLMGVKAVFRRSGGMKEIWASAHKDTINIEGFADTQEYEVLLYAVDNSDNMSEAVPVKVYPLTPPIEVSRSTLQLVPTFGGIKATWENEMRKDVALTIYVADSTGEMKFYDRYFSTAANGICIFRGLDAEPQTIKIEMNDHWNNFSRNLDTVITPLLEKEIVGRLSASQYVWRLYGDNDGTDLYRGEQTVPIVAARPFHNVHDGVLMSTNWALAWHSDRPAKKLFFGGTDESWVYPPKYFTIDMGRKASYSRMKWYIFDRSPFFSASVPLDFELWATNEPKPVGEIGDGSLADNLKYWTSWPEAGGTDEWKNDWVKIADCKVELPSGSPAHVVSITNAEDVAFVRNGLGWDILPEYQDIPFRYIRFVIKEINTDDPATACCEIKFWGAYAD